MQKNSNIEDDFKLLLDLGFEKVADIVAPVGRRLWFEYLDEANELAGHTGQYGGLHISCYNTRCVYAWVADREEVLYIGKANELYSRLRDRINANEGSSDFSQRELLRETLRLGAKIEVFAIFEVRLPETNFGPLNLSNVEGLEKALINTISTDWNRRL